MLGVKITIFVIVIAVIWGIGVRLYLEENTAASIHMRLTQKYAWYVEVAAWLIVFSVIGIIYSAAYLLFIR